MKLLVVGSGGREHAIAKEITRRSDRRNSLLRERESGHGQRWHSGSCYP